MIEIIYESHDLGVTLQIGTNKSSTTGLKSYQKTFDEYFCQIYIRMTLKTESLWLTNIQTMPDEHE